MMKFIEIFFLEDSKSSESNRQPLDDIPMHEDYLNDEDTTSFCNSEDMDDTSFNDTVIPSLSEPINLDVKDLDDKATETYLHQHRLTLDAIEKMYKEIKKMPKNSVKKDPEGLKVKLMPHQLQALNWMKWRETLKPAGGILGNYLEL